MLHAKRKLIRSILERPIHAASVISWGTNCMWGTNGNISWRKAAQTHPKPEGVELVRAVKGKSTVSFEARSWRQGCGKRSCSKKWSKVLKRGRRAALFPEGSTSDQTALCGNVQKQPKPPHPGLKMSSSTWGWMGGQRRSTGGHQ